jgi:hypothetical protein
MKKRVGKGKPMQWLVAHADHPGEDCLVWPFARRSDGYANLSTGPAHRVMCKLAHGNPPTDAHHAAHSCGYGKGGCVNPKHLRWATALENSADKELHGTQARGERHGAAKITAKQVIEVRRRWGGGETQASLARAFGLKFQSVWEIVHRRNWKHLTEAA